MGDLPQIQTRVDFKKLRAQTSPTALRRHSFSDYLLCRGNMDSEQRSRKNNSIDATQDATTHFSDKRKYKKIEKQNIEPKEENGKVDITEMCSTDDESGETTIEEEEWIDYIKRSTGDALEKMEHAKIRCWNRTHKK